MTSTLCAPQPQPPLRSALTHHPHRPVAGTHHHQAAPESPAALPRTHSCLLRPPVLLQRKAPEPRAAGERSRHFPEYLAGAAGTSALGAMPPAHARSVARQASASRYPQEPESAAQQARMRSHGPGRSRRSASPKAGTAPHAAISFSKRAATASMNGSVLRYVLASTAVVP